MDKIKGIFKNWRDQIDVYLNEETEGKEAEVKLERKTLEDGTVIEYENLEPGTEVFKIGTTEDGSEEKVPADDGEYKIADGEMLVVVDGKVSEVKKEESETTEDTEMESDKKDDKKVGIDLENATDYLNIEGIKSLVNNGFISFNIELREGEVASLSYSTFDEMLEPEPQQVEVVNQEKENKESKKDSDVKESKEKIELSKKEKEIEDLKENYEKQISDLKAKFKADVDELGKKFSKINVTQAPVENESKPKGKRTHTDLLLNRIKNRREEYKKENVY